MKHVGTITLHTKRLILRRFTIEDANDVFYNYAGCDNVTKYLTWPSHKSVNVSKTYMFYVISNYENLDYYQWAIELKSTHQVIGAIGVVNINEETETIGLGFVLGQRYWNQGIISEAVQSFMEFMRDKVQPKKIIASHDVNNPASGIVMKKVGMKYIKSYECNNNEGVCLVDMYELIL